MNESKQRAENALAAKSRFLSTMSHEIRTPLNGILGAVQLLNDSDLNAEQRELVELFQSSGDSLLRIVNDTLDFSKIDSGHLRLESRTFSPIEVIRQCFALFTAAARQKEIQYDLDHCNLDPNLAVVGDELRFRQVLLNLIGNAIKFTENGSARIVASAENRDKSSYELRVSISDTGIGMSPDQIRNLFKEFSQADESITRRFGGTGLGLTITKRLIDLMAGGLQVSSQQGEGSTFVSTMKFQSAARQTSATSEILSKSEFTQSQFEGMRVLIIDDMPANHTVLKAFLKKIRSCSSRITNGGYRRAQSIRGSIV